MEVGEIKKVVVSQKEEITETFKREKIIKREYNKLERYISHPNILVILGIRRCGKSIFSLQILENRKFGYINFDDERLAGIEARDLDKVLQAFYELYGDVEYIILDEPQNVANWELFANRLRRTKKVVITGSNSKLLSGELATHLTGRHVDVTLFPFSFREFLSYNEFEFGKEDFYSTKKVSMVKNSLEEYIDIGGFPEVYKFGKKIIVKTYEDIVNKDIFGRYSVKYKKTFRELIKYLITNFSGEFSYSKLKNILGVKDVHTIRNWVDYLATSYLVFVIERFSYKLKEQIIAPKKIYSIDTGLISSISFKVSQKSGALMENLVAVELLRRKSNWYPYEIYYWKDHQQREVDFVVKERENVKQLIQVCYDIEDVNVKEREIKSLLRASKELKCRNLTVITWDYSGEESINGQNISYIPLWRWLLDLAV